MTPLLLQDSLLEEMKQLLADSGQDFQFFAQSPPARKSDDDPPPIPYCNVILEDGSDDEESKQDVVIVFATKDTNRDFQGYRDVMIAIEKVRTRFRRNQEVGGCFIHDGPIRWAPPTDNSTYPYFFGAVLLSFRIPRITQTSDFT